jgi:hypothetical protein
MAFENYFVINLKYQINGTPGTQRDVVFSQLAVKGLIRTTMRPVWK